MIRLPALVIFALATLTLVAADTCSDGKSCPEACCPTGTSNQYYCCSRPGDQDRGIYLVGMGSFWKDYWALFVGLLIAGLIISIICSVLCCLYCNGCLWHRRRNPDMYAGTAPYAFNLVLADPDLYHDRCCGGAFPLGTIIYSPYVGPPPHHPHHPPSYYDESPDSSVRSGASGMGGNRKGVRFDHETTVKTFENQPKSALKKPSPNGGINGRNSPNLLL